MIYVYIIQSLKDHGYYVGITSNLDKRLEKHNKETVLSTKNRRPFKLIVFEDFESYSLARNREKETKSYKGGNSFKRLVFKK